MKKADPPLLPASSLDPKLQEIFTNGIPASIDSDPVHDRALSSLLTSIDLGLSVRFGNRAKLYREWLALPSLTLPQASWLLLGRDPFEPLAPEPEPPPVSLQRQHAEICNRLECEVVAGTLKTIGQAIVGFERRFRFAAVAQAARQAGIAEGAAEHALLIAENAGKQETRTLAWQTERVDQRIIVHRRLVEKIQVDQPQVVSNIVAKGKRSRNRKGQASPLNVQLDMPQLSYEIAFRALFERVHGAKAPYHITRVMLDQDREQLNIKFKRGKRAKNPATETPTA